MDTAATTYVETAAEESWENEGGACHPETPAPTYSPAISGLTATEQTILRLLAEEFFGSLQAA